MDPFKEFTHGGTLNVAEILFNTRFDYLFPLLAANKECLLPTRQTTQGALLSLGKAMAADTLTSPGDSTIPAVFTYFGQFIDHNITAQTDREIGASLICTPDGNVMDLKPLPAKEVVKVLVNGRRPKLDLNQVYGDGPALGTNPSPTEGDELFDLATLDFKVVADAPGFDVPRQKDGTAIIADMRNNENLNISQLHCAFLLFHNKVAAGLPAAMTKDQRYIRARQLVRWAYQYVVVNDYLPNVCDPVVVEDVAANGVRFYAPDNDKLFMPLEFSVAAFRFGHSMICPKYKLNAGTSLTLMQILRLGPLLAGAPLPKIPSADIIEWHNFAIIPAHGAPQSARKINPLIALDLGTLPVFLPGSTIPVGALFQHLAQRNLLRGFLLSIPTGQALADGMQTKPLTPGELRGPDQNSPIHDAVVAGGFDYATPLWYYILREAEVQQDGNRLGSVGSRIIAETLTALVHRDGASYWNNMQDPAVKANGIDVGGGTIIATIGDLLKFSGAPL